MRSTDRGEYRQAAGASRPNVTPASFALNWGPSVPTLTVPFSHKLLGARAVFHTTTVRYRFRRPKLKRFVTFFAKSVCPSGIVDAVRLLRVTKTPPPVSEILQSKDVRVLGLGCCDRASDQAAIRKTAATQIAVA